MKIHRWLDFKVTRRCSKHASKCRYCSVPTLPVDAEEDMPLDLIHRTILDARVLGFDTFWFLGGEPSVRRDAPRLFEPLGDDSGVMLTVVTNGLAARWELYDALFQTRAARAMVQVSLDTLATDNLRGIDPERTLALVRAIHDRALEQTCPGHDCAVEVHAVISRENHETFPDLVAHLHREGIGTTLAMICPWRVSEEPRRHDEFTMSEAMAIADRIEAARTTPGCERSNDLTAGFIRHMVSGSGLPPSRDCGAGLTHLVVNGDGTVYRCIAESFGAGPPLGDLRLERLHQVLRRATRTTGCLEKTDCFDAFAWDNLAVSTI